jgi:hypothetical protein
MGPVPKAQCGPSDRIEGGLQGQTTSQERASGDSERGYNCNLELVGQFRGEGAFSQDGSSRRAAGVARRSSVLGWFFRKTKNRKGAV